MTNTKISSRVTVVLNVYHNTPNRNTTGPEPTRFSKFLDTTDVAYQRTVQLNNEWQSIDLGWLKDSGCSMLILQNVTERLPGLTPTDEEIDAIKASIVEYGVKSESGEAIGVGSLSPEEGVPLSPLDVSKIVVRSRTQSTLAYFVVPK